MPRVRAPLLAEVGLADRLEHRPAELSGGEKQRAALARALIRRPELLLCDEPTGNLDRAAADSVADLLLQLHAAQNTILVVVTHSAALAERFPVRYEMDGGLGEAMTNPKSKSIQASQLPMTKQSERGWNCVDVGSRSWSRSLGIGLELGIYTPSPCP